MKIVKVSFTLFFLISLVGCANPGIVQVSPNVYQLGRADHGGIFGNKDALKAGVISDANTFAEKQGKVAIPVRAKEHPMGIMGDWASYEYTFRVVDKDAPDALVPMVLEETGSKKSAEWRNMGGKDLFYIAKPVKRVPLTNKDNSR